MDRKVYPAQDRAEKAWNTRREARLQAGAMMRDTRERELLRARDMLLYGSADGPSLEFLLARLKDAGIEGDDAYEAIIAGASRADREINRLLDL